MASSSSQGSHAGPAERRPAERRIHRNPRSQAAETKDDAPDPKGTVMPLFVLPCVSSNKRPSAYAGGEP